MYRINTRNGMFYASTLFEAEGKALDKCQQNDVARIDAKVSGRWVPWGSVTEKKGFRVYPASSGLHKSPRFGR